MSNNTQTSLSNLALIPLTSNLEHVLRYQTLIFHALYNHKNFGRAGSIEQEPIQIMDQAFSLMDHEDPPLSLTSWSQLASAVVGPNIELSPQVCDHIRQIVVEDVAREHSKLSHEATQQALEMLMFLKRMKS